jgi:hypothetical protein
MRITPTELDALEAALAKATPGEWVWDHSDIYTTAGIVGDIVCQPPDGDCEESLEFWPHNRHLIIAARNALPALIAAARATVPEPIGEKHRKGNWWLVFDGERKRWVQAYWMQSWGFWRIAGGNSIKPDPTHALPIPPAPEGPDA